MKYTILSRKLLTLLVCASICAAIGNAQPMDTTGRWKEFTIPFSSIDSLYTRYYSHGSFFFSDSVTGYWLLFARKSNDKGTEGVYRTKDAGRTWHRWTTNTPFPHQQQGSWGISRSGFRSGDSGRTWRRIAVRGSDSAQVIAYGPLGTAGFPQVMAALYAYRPTRLAFTLNGGTTWVYPDTVKQIKTINPNDTTDVQVYSFLSDTTIFGAVPVAESPNSIVWKQLLGIIDSTLYVTLTDEQFKGYLWVMDLAKRTGAVYPIPLYPNLTLLRKDLMVAWDAGAGVLLRSSDAGKTWDRTEDLQWLDWITLRFFPNGYAACSNAWINDTGRTWTRISAPYPIEEFWPVDSAHWFIASGGAYSPPTVFARTSDAGYSWEDNGFIGLYGGSGANNGVVMLGTTIGHLLRSSDSAQTWSDLYSVPNALPKGIGHIKQIFWPNRGKNPEWVAALALQTGPTTLAKACLMESCDTGKTWRVTIQYDDVTLLDSRIQFIENSERLTAYIIINGRLHRSTDTLRTWERRSDEEMLVIRMIDNQYGIAGRKGELLRSVDGGATWLTTHDLTEPTRTIPEYLTTFGNGYTMAVAPDQLAQKDKWTIYRSFDNGATWSASPSYSPIREWGSVYWVSPAQAYMRSGSQLGYSTDSGRAFVFVRTVRYGGLLSDARYFYFISLDSFKVGRWRIGGEPTSGVPTAPSIVESLWLQRNILSSDQPALLRMRLASAAVASVGIITMAGEETELIAEQPFHAGEHTLPLAVSGLPSGRYLVKIQIGKELPQLLPLVIQR